MSGEISYVFAGFWWRVLAAVIDWIVLLIAGSIIAGVVVAVDPAGAEFGGSHLIGIVIWWLYFALLESSEKRATLGKMACGLIVADLAGGRIGFGRATGRLFAKFLSSAILMIGYLMVAFTKRKQGLHDMIAGTLVLRGQPPAERVPLPNAASPPPVVR